MTLEKVIKLLEGLPEDAGLEYEENWDSTIEVQIWRKEVLEALEYAVNALKQGEMVGTLQINGEEYKVVK